MTKAVCTLMIYLFAAVASAQTVVYRTDAGLMLLCKTKEQDFALKLDGKEFRLFRNGGSGVELGRQGDSDIS